MFRLLFCNTDLESRQFFLPYGNKQLDAYTTNIGGKSILSSSYQCMRATAAVFIKGLIMELNAIPQKRSADVEGKPGPS